MISSRKWSRIKGKKLSSKPKKSPKKDGRVSIQLERLQNALLKYKSADKKEPAVQESVMCSNSNNIQVMNCETLMNSIKGKMCIRKEKGKLIAKVESVTSEKRRGSQIKRYTDAKRTSCSRPRSPVITCRQSCSERKHSIQSRKHSQKRKDISNSSRCASQKRRNTSKDSRNNSNNQKCRRISCESGMIQKDQNGRGIADSSNRENVSYENEIPDTEANPIRLKNDKIQCDLWSASSIDNYQRMKEMGKRPIQDKDTKFKEKCCKKVAKYRMRHSPNICRQNQYNMCCEDVAPQYSCSQQRRNKSKNSNRVYLTNEILEKEQFSERDLEMSNNSQEYQQIHNREIKDNSTQYEKRHSSNRSRNSKHSNPTDQQPKALMRETPEIYYSQNEVPENNSKDSDHESYRRNEHNEESNSKRSKKRGRTKNKREHYLQRTLQKHLSMGHCDIIIKRYSNTESSDYACLSKHSKEDSKLSSITSKPTNAIENSKNERSAPKRENHEERSSMDKVKDEPSYKHDNSDTVNALKSELQEVKQQLYNLKSMITARNAMERDSDEDEQNKIKESLQYLINAHEVQQHEISVLRENLENIKYVSQTSVVHQDPLSHLEDLDDQIRKHMKEYFAKEEQRVNEQYSKLTQYYKSMVDEICSKMETELRAVIEKKTKDFNTSMQKEIRSLVESKDDFVYDRIKTEVKDIIRSQQKALDDIVDTEVNEVVEKKEKEISECTCAFTDSAKEHSNQVEKEFKEIEKDIKKLNKKLKHFNEMLDQNEQVLNKMVKRTNDGCAGDDYQKYSTHHTLHEVKGNNIESNNQPDPYDNLIINHDSICDAILKQVPRGHPNLENESYINKCNKISVLPYLRAKYGTGALSCDGYRNNGADATKSFNQDLSTPVPKYCEDDLYDKQIFKSNCRHSVYPCQVRHFADSLGKDHSSLSRNSTTYKTYSTKSCPKSCISKDTMDKLFNKYQIQSRRENFQGGGNHHMFDNQAIRERHFSSTKSM